LAANFKVCIARADAGKGPGRHHDGGRIEEDAFMNRSPVSPI